jgi:6-phosphogluconolactonase (cycloisomerase 2 family)
MNINRRWAFVLLNIFLGSILLLFAGCGITTPKSAGSPGISGNSGGGSGSGGGGGGTVSGGQYVYIGDSDNLQIDGFKVNSDGTLSAVPGSPFQMSGRGDPFQTAGNTLAVVGQFLFADATAVSSGIAGFKIDPATGSLTSVNTGPSKGGPWFRLAGNSQQNALYTSGSVCASISGGISCSNSIAGWTVNSDGSLKMVSTITSQGNQVVGGAIAVDHQSRFLYSWYRGLVYVFGLNQDGSIGSQVSGSPFKIGTPYQFTSPNDPNACFGDFEQPVLAADPAGGRFLYASCDANAQVDEIVVSDSGQLTLIGTVPSPGPGTELSSLTISNDGALLFGTEEEANSVVSFKIDRSTGQLMPGAPVPSGTRPNQAASDFSNHFLYATNGSSNLSKNNNHPGSNNVSEYAFTSAGAMTPLPDSPKTVGSRPKSVIAVKF